MRPNFKNIDIATDAFNVKHNEIAEGEKWITPELIPVKPIYTKKTSKDSNTSTSYQVFLHS